MQKKTDYGLDEWIAYDVYAGHQFLLESQQERVWSPSRHHVYEEE